MLVPKQQHCTEHEYCRNCRRRVLGAYRRLASCVGLQAVIEARAEGGARNRSSPYAGTAFVARALLGH